MNPEGPRRQLGVWTATPAPAGSVHFAMRHQASPRPPSDATVSATLDATGLHPDRLAVPWHVRLPTPNNLASATSWLRATSSRSPAR